MQKKRFEGAAFLMITLSFSELGAGLVFNNFENFSQGDIGVPVFLHGADIKSLSTERNEGDAEVTYW